MSILLGAQNIEQTKTLHHTSLQIILGDVIKHPSNQRLALKEVATIDFRDAILRFNGEMINVTNGSDFYYDPHTIHYTGQLKILATWCPSVRLADKGINMDFIHTSDGYPVYFDTTDNFYDLRERFTNNINHFRSLMGFSTDQILTVIVDRGIFSTEVFSEFVLSPNAHIITWEKGYNNDKWDENKPYDTGCIFRRKNHRSDTRLVHYQYQDGIWDKDTNMRQIIVRILDKNWNILIEVSILTDDKQRDATQVIELMLKRWVQENDFKYLKKHFGINEITTYAFVDYKDLKEIINDKLHTGGHYKELTWEINRIRIKLKTALFRKYNFQKKHPNSEEVLPKREELRQTKIWKEVDCFDSMLKQHEQQRAELFKKTSKINDLIEEDYKKLDTNTKSFVDAIKILARNMFYLELQPFKEKYNNYRDDHTLFRNFTRAAGKIHMGKEKIVVSLMPTMEYQKKIKGIFNEIINEMNKKQPKWNDGSNKIFRIELLK